MCGISGVVLSDKTINKHIAKYKTHPLLDILYKSILEIQHRGYDGVGIATFLKDDKVNLIKEQGMIKPFFKKLQNTNNSIHSWAGIAHTRYKTVGPCTKSASQPLLNSDNTICLAHNGQLDLESFTEKGRTYNPDSTFIIEYINHRLNSLATENKTPERLEEAIFLIICQLFNDIGGSYSCLLLVAGVGLVAFRDPRGIRPLILGASDNGDYILASESVCLKNIPDFKVVRDIKPGECIILKQNCEPISRNLIIKSVPFTPCVFEYIYLSSPESVIDQLSVTTAREELGKTLGKHICKYYSELHIDYVIPVPESSCIAANSTATYLQQNFDQNIKYLHILKLNTERQKARSFILPTQEEREKAVKDKFIINPDSNLSGKNILIIDDSIVRGTTLRHIMKSIRATYPDISSIYVASIAPPIKDKNTFGIDIPNTELLIAYNKKVNEIATNIEADLVIYQDLQEMLEMFDRISPNANQFEYSMFVNGSN